MPSLARSETLKKESGTSTKDKILEILGLVITLDDALFLLLGSLYLVGVVGRTPRASDRPRGDTTGRGDNTARP